MQDQYYRRLAHAQSFPQHNLRVAQHSRPAQQSMRQSMLSFTEHLTKPAKKHSKEPSDRSDKSSPPKNNDKSAPLQEAARQQKYLEVQNARDQWAQVVNARLSEHHHLQQQLDVARQGIVPPGHEDLFKWASCQQTVLAGIIRRLNNRIRENQEAGQKAEQQWSFLDTEFKKLMV